MSCDRPRAPAQETMLGLKLDSSRTKAKKMTLTNHKTAFNALRDLPEEHVEALKAQGYNELGHSA